MAFAKARIAVQKALGSDPGMDHVRIDGWITSIARARSSDVMKYHASSSWLELLQRWMRGRHARQKRFQLALAVNLSVGENSTLSD